MTATAPIPALCVSCEHRRPPRARADAMFDSDQLNSRPTPARLQWLREQAIAEETERAAVARRTWARLSAPPQHHDWCGARSSGEEYFFCTWLGTDPCSHFRALPGRPPSSIHPVLAAPPPDEPTPSMWSADIGSVLAPPMELTPGPRGFEVSYDVGRGTDERLCIEESALFQTLLLFGGPGAGKTVLFKRLLRQFLAHDKRPGCLLLDPKGVLGDWLIQTLEDLKRRPPIVIKPKAGDDAACNVIDLPLEPAQIGKLMAEVVAAEAGGIDPGWIILISDLLESGATVLSAGGRTLTAAALLEGVLYESSYLRKAGDRSTQYWDIPVRVEAHRLLNERRRGSRLDPDLQRAALRIKEYFEKTEDKLKRFVRQAIESSLGELVRADWSFLSTPRAAKSLYESVHDDGQVVLVSIGQGAAAFQRSLCTLMKAGYQQTVLASLATGGVRRPGWHRFSVLACDEYAQIATEGRSGLVSDSSFFSLSREAGCTSLLALQSLATGRSRFDQAMRDRWEGILGNVGLRFFMRLNDLETAKLASEFAGRVKRIENLQTRSSATQGTTIGDSLQMLDVEAAPPTVFTNQFATGVAFVHGTVDSGRANTATFIKVPL